MSKTKKHQATYDYLHQNKDVRGSLLYSIKRFFNKLNCPKTDASRISWYKHKNKKMKMKLFFKCLMANIILFISLPILIPLAIISMSERVVMLTQRLLDWYFDKLDKMMEDE